MSDAQYEFTRPLLIKTDKLGLQQTYTSASPDSIRASVDKQYSEKEANHGYTRQKAYFLKWLPFMSRTDRVAAHVDWVKSSQQASKQTDGDCKKPLRTNIPFDEVKLHCKPDDVWVILKDKVYDITSYLSSHPGGAAVLLKVAGKDALPLFNKYHAWVNFESVLSSCLVGTLEPRDKLAEYEARYKKNSKICF